MSSRNRPNQPRPHLAPETLESRTLLSAPTDNALHGDWMVRHSYAWLHLRPAMSIAPRAAAPRVNTSGAGLTRVASSAETAAPPTFLSGLTVDVNPDGTSGAYIQYQPGMEGGHAATARWDGGAPVPVLIDQPGENNSAGTGAVYALHESLGVGTHTLELTLTNTTHGGSATISTTFTVDSVQPSEPQFVASPDDGMSIAPGDDLGTSEAQGASLVGPPTVASVYVGGTTGTRRSRPTSPPTRSATRPTASWRPTPTR